MDFASAKSVLDRVLDPIPMLDFFSNTVGRGPIRIEGSQDSARTDVLGPDPEETLLAAYEHLAPKLTCHAAEPLGPPPHVGPLANARKFRAKIDAFHQLGYTVRLNEVRGVSPPLDEVVRALETVLHQPVEVQAFWSRGDARAPVHYDDFDIIVIQLRGRKRWYISSEPSELPNAWKTIPSGAPITLGRHQVLDVGPGDLLYLPRGTYHSVDAQADSIHVSIGFIPLTMREAIIAALDHLSDLDKPYRTSVGNHLAMAVANNDFGGLPSAVRDGLARLMGAVQSEGFVAEAMQRRSSRVIGDLQALPKPRVQPALSRETALRRAPGAIGHLTANANTLDVAYPGGRLYLNIGAAPAVRFILANDAFRLGDIPGGMDLETSIALVQRFVEVGFLEVAPR